jgi:hypothetical protein
MHIEGNEVRLKSPGANLSAAVINLQRPMVEALLYRYRKTKAEE